MIEKKDADFHMRINKELKESVREKGKREGFSSLAALFHYWMAQYLKKG